GPRAPARGPPSRRGRPRGRTRRAAGTRPPPARTPAARSPGRSGRERPATSPGGRRISGSRPRTPRRDAPAAGAPGRPAQPDAQLAGPVHRGNHPHRVPRGQGTHLSVVVRPPRGLEGIRVVAGHDEDSHGRPLPGAGRGPRPRGRGTPPGPLPEANVPA